MSAGIPSAAASVPPPSKKPAEPTAVAVPALGGTTAHAKCPDGILPSEWKELEDAAQALDLGPVTHDNYQTILAQVHERLTDLESFQDSDADSVVSST